MGGAGRKGQKRGQPSGWFENGTGLYRVSDPATGSLLPATFAQALRPTPRYTDKHHMKHSRPPKTTVVFVIRKMCAASQRDERKPRVTTKSKMHKQPSWSSGFGGAGRTTSFGPSEPRSIQLDHLRSYVGQGLPATIKKRHRPCAQDKRAGADQVGSFWAPPLSHHGKAH